MKINTLSIFILIFCLLFGCKIKRNTELKEKIVYPNMIQNNYDHFIYKNGKKYLHAKIKHAEFYEKNDTIECEGLNAKIYNSDQELTTVINSDSGFVNQQEKKMYFSGNVEFELFEHDTKLYSEELVMDYKNNKLVSDGSVLLEKEDGSYIKSSMMDSDIKKESTKFQDMEIKYFYEEDEKK